MLRAGPAGGVAAAPRQNRHCLGVRGVAGLTAGFAGPRLPGWATYPRLPGHSDMRPGLGPRRARGRRTRTAASRALRARAVGPGRRPGDRGRKRSACEAPAPAARPIASGTAPVTVSESGLQVLVTSHHPRRGHAGPSNHIVTIMIKVPARAPGRAPLTSTVPESTIIESRLAGRVWRRRSGYDPKAAAAQAEILRVTRRGIH